jgi:hypothetical protein
MTRRLFVILAVVAVLTALVAAPVSATKPAPTLRGVQLMVLNQDLETGAFGLYGCGESEVEPGELPISWFGSIDIEGTTYGMALYPLPGRITGDGTILHYEEEWKVWTGEFTLTEDLRLADCTPGEYVLSGTDTGVGSFRNPMFRSNGTVDEAFEPFAGWLDRKVHQDGATGPVDFDVLEGVLGFHGDLRLN